MLIIRKGSSAVHLEENEVTNPDFFGGVFRKGEKIIWVMKIKSGNRKGREIIEIFRHIRQNVVPSLKARGFSGVAGETSNNALRNYLVKMGATEFDLPGRFKTLEWLGLKKFVPPKYWFRPVKGVALRI